MSTILGLAMKVSADASSVPKALTPVERALNSLQAQVEKATRVFAPFTETSGAAARAQEQFAERFANLADQLKAKAIGPQEYAAAFAQLTEEAKKAAQEFERGIEITNRYTTAEEDRAAQLREIADLLEKGAVSEQTAARARAELSGDNARAAEAEKSRLAELNRLQNEAAAITEKYRTDADRAREIIEKVNAALEAGRITEETHRRAIEDATGATAAAAEAERQRQAIIAEGARIQKEYGDQTKIVADEIERLVELNKLGQIDQTALNNAAIEKLGLDRQAAESARARAGAVAAAERQQAEAFAEARKIEEQAAAQANRERAALEAEAEAIRQRNLTAQERFDQEVQRSTFLKEAGVLTEQDFNRELQRQADLFAKATVEAAKSGETIKKAGDAGTLKFNELSGILSALPGPIGSVAGRLSGLASAGEGLSRIFAGGLQSGLTSIGTTVAGLVNPFTIGAAAVVGLGTAAVGVARGLASLEAETEKLQNAADKLGVSFGFLETLQAAADMSGVSFETVNSAMTRLLKTLAGADEESKQATAALGRLNVSLNDLDGLKTEDQLRLIAERLRGIEDPAKRAAAATAIFGKSGAEILPFFQNLAIAEQTLTRFNARLSEIDVGRILALGDSFDGVRASITGLGNELLTPFIGLSQSIADALAPTIAVFGKNLGAVLDALSPLASVVGLAINTLGQFGAALQNLIGTVFEPAAASGRVLSGAFDAISRSVTVVFGGINDAINGFREFFRFEGVATSFRNAFAQIGETISRVAAIIGAFAEAVGTGLGRVAGVIGESVSQFLEFTGLGSVISGFATAVGNAFGGLWDTIKGIVGRIGGFIEQVLQFAENWLGIKRDVEQPVEVEVGVSDNGAIAQLASESKTLQTSLDGITKSVSDAINESAKFGQAGFDAALKYQQSIDDLKSKLAGGVFNEETFRREAEKAGVAFKEELTRIEEDSKLELQIKADAEKVLGDIQQKISGAINEAAKFGEAGQQAAVGFQDKLRTLGAEFEKGVLNQTALTAEVAKATEEYNKQIEGFKKIEELQRGIAAADKQRLDQIAAAQQETKTGETDLEFVLRQQKKLIDDIAEARKKGNVIAADAATAQLGQLEKLEAKLADQDQAAEQGFGEGFTKAFEKTRTEVGELVKQAEKFGNAGAIAAQQLQQGVAKAQQQAKDGIFNAESYAREVARQQKLFEDGVARLEELKRRETENAQLVFQAKVEANNRVEQFLASKLTERQRAEMDAAKQLEERKKQAALNVQAIEQRIALEKKANELARENGNLKEARAGANRIRQLEQARLAEQKIANGRVKAEQQQLRQFQQGNTAPQQFQSLIARQNDLFVAGIQNAYAGANAALARSASAAEQQIRRMQELSRPTNQLAMTADVRTAEGQALVLETAQQAQDPALIEQRLQTRLLNTIAAGITGAATNYFNQPVAIVGAARLG